MSINSPLPLNSGEELREALLCKTFRRRSNPKYLNLRSLSTIPGSSSADGTLDSGDRVLTWLMSLSWTCISFLRRRCEPEPYSETPQLRTGFPRFSEVALLLSTCQEGSRLKTPPVQLARSRGQRQLRPSGGFSDPSTDFCKDEVEPLLKDLLIHSTRLGPSEDEETGNT